MYKMRSSNASCLCYVIVAAACVQYASASTFPAPVRAQLADLVEQCTSAGGRAEVGQNAVTRASLTTANFDDHIIDSAQIHCAGAMTAFGGTAGQQLVLVPSIGKPRTVYAHTWRVFGDGKMDIEIVGGIACAQGRQDQCEKRLTWNGTEFAPVNGGARIEQVNASAEGRSIVGDWAESRDGCASPMAGLVRVGSKSLTTDEMSCTFRDVARSGATVTWTGSCDEGRGAKPAKVTATESAGRLTIRFANGNAWSPLMRCPR